jgi:hypothetical protein
MANLITDRDMRDQLALVLGGDPYESYDVNAIVAKLQETYGTVHIDTIPHDTFWTIVLDHAR